MANIALACFFISYKMSPYVCHFNPRVNHIGNQLPWNQFFQSFCFSIFMSINLVFSFFSVIYLNSIEYFLHFIFAISTKTFNKNGLCVYVKSIDREREKGYKMHLNCKTESINIILKLIKRTSGKEESPKFIKFKC